MEDIIYITSKKLKISKGDALLLLMKYLDLCFTDMDQIIITTAERIGMNHCSTMMHLIYYNWDTETLVADMKLRRGIRTMTRRRGIRTIYRNFANRVVLNSNQDPLVFCQPCRRNQISIRTTCGCQVCGSCLKIRVLRLIANGQISVRCVECFGLLNPMLDFDSFTYCVYKTLGTFHRSMETISPMSQVVWRNKYKLGACVIIVYGVKKTYDVKHYLNHMYEMWVEENPKKMRFLNHAKAMYGNGNNPVKPKNFVRLCWISGKELTSEFIGDVKEYGKGVISQVLPKVLKKCQKVLVTKRM